MNDLSHAIRIAREVGGEVSHVTKLHVGPIHSKVAGRTDHLPVHVPSGSYVLPADIVSALGEGNTAAGFKHVIEGFEDMRRNFGGTPYGGHGGPYGSSIGTLPYMRADGGGVGTGQPVACVLAGGEYVIPPEDVHIAGDGDIGSGHRALDGFVKNYRAKTIKTLQSLPGPRKD